MVDLKNKNPNWGLALQDCNCVVHLASMAHVINEDSESSLLALREINLDGTLRLANQALEAGVEKFIFLSSIGVNGAATFGKPFNLNTPPKPHNSYAVSKFEAERALQDLVKKTNMKFNTVENPYYGLDL